MSGRKAINATKMEDIKQIGKKSVSPMPAPQEGKKDGPKKANSNSPKVDHQSGWF